MTSPRSETTENSESNGCPDAQTLTDLMLEKLTVAISALGDTALSIGMFGHETGVHGVRLQDTRGLFENGLNN